MSKLIETRAEFQQLAEDRLAEAKALLDLGRWDGAYYLAGYAVELALKACIIKRLMATDGFPDKDLSKNSYTHVVRTLAETAGIYDSLKTAMDADPNLELNWNLVREWSEQKRYHRIGKDEAESLFAAITDVATGVLTWIRTHW